MTTDYVRALEQESETFVHSLDRDPLLGNVINGDADQRDYVRFLVGTYHYVRWSGFLLAKTAQGLRHSGRCPSLLQVAAAKAEEEAPHDRWVLCDLRRCGVNGELVKGSAVPSAVRAYLEWGSSFAEAGSPAFLGAAYTLEYVSMRRAKLASENLRARGAIPNINQAVSFLAGHGDADHGHVAELEAVLRGVARELDQAEIMFSSRVLCRLYPHFFTLPGC